MKKLTFLTSLLCLAFSVSAQNQTTQESPTTAAFNGFQRTKKKYPDSAIRYLQSLSISSPEDIEDLLHNSLAQSFLNDVQEKMTSDTAFLAMIKKRNITLDSVLSQIKDEKKVHTSFSLN